MAQINPEEAMCGNKKQSHGVGSGEWAGALSWRINRDRIFSSNHAKCLVSTFGWLFNLETKINYTEIEKNCERHLSIGSKLSCPFWTWRSFACPLWWLNFCFGVISVLRYPDAMSITQPTMFMIKFSEGNVKRSSNTFNEWVNSITLYIY